MRAFFRYILAPLLVAVTAFFLNGPAHLTAASGHPGVRITSTCPDGTNWDAAIQGCV